MGQPHLKHRIGASLLLSDIYDTSNAVLSEMCAPGALLITVFEKSRNAKSCLEAARAYQRNISSKNSRQEWTGVFPSLKEPWLRLFQAPVSKRLPIKKMSLSLLLQSAHREPPTVMTLSISSTDTFQSKFFSDILQCNVMILRERTLWKSCSTHRPLFVQK